MSLLACIAGSWQKTLPYLSTLGIVIWIALFRSDPLSERALWLGLLVIYMLHQIEEHLWPGGFRQFANAHVFKSGNDNCPSMPAALRLSISALSGCRSASPSFIPRRCAGSVLAGSG